MRYAKYSPEELFERLFDVVTLKITHPYYDRVVAHADWCRKMMTGHDQDDILITYKRRETEEQKQQRISVTNSRTKYVTNKIYNLFSEVHRADRLVNRITKDNEDSTEPVAIVSENIEYFNNNESLEAYLDEYYRTMNFYDPNAWLIMEFENPDPINQRPVAYPFQAMSDDVIDFEYARGCLQYVIVMISKMVPNRDPEDDDVEIKQYTLYGAGVSYRMTHVPEAADYVMDAEMIRVSIAEEETEQTVYVERFENLLNEVPAERIGYLRDPETNGETYVCPFWAAEDILTDLIWKKSEYDLAHALHGFYQKFIYVDDCPRCQGTGQIEHTTIGWIECPSCEGDGVNHHTTTQDIIEIVRVDTKDQHIPLDEMVHYEQIPMELIKQQKEDIRDLERDVFNAIFGSNVLERSEIAVTATEKQYDWRAVNNTLLPYARRYELIYKDLVLIIADIKQQEDIKVEYAFPASFDLETLDDLLTQRKMAKDAGAPWQVLWAIDLNILQKQHEDNHEMVMTYKAVEDFRPYHDLPLAEKQYILNSLPKNDPQKVLYLYFDDIMSRIMMEYPNFAMLEYQTQRELVDRAVQDKITSLTAEAQAQTLFGGQAPADDRQGATEPS